MYKLIRSREKGTQPPLLKTKSSRKCRPWLRDLEGLIVLFFLSILTYILEIEADLLIAIKTNLKKYNVRAEDVSQFGTVLASHARSPGFDSQHHLNQPW